MKFIDLPHRALTAAIALAVAASGGSAAGCVASHGSGTDVATQQEQQNAIVVQDANSAQSGGDKPETREAKTSQQKPVVTLSAKMKAAKADVAKLVKPYGQKARVCVAKVSSEEDFGFNAKAKTAAASLIKLAVLAEIMVQIDEGELSWGDHAGASGVSVESATRKMISESDNDAANTLIDLVGMNAVNKRCAALGLNATELNRKMLTNGDENTTCARDMGIILRGIANSTVASKASCKKAEGFLKEQVRRYGIPSGISSNIEVGNKTGELNGVRYDSKLDVSSGSVPVRHDAAIIYADEPFVVVVMTVGIEENEAHSLMGNIASALEEDLG